MTDGNDSKRGSSRLNVINDRCIIVKLLIVKRKSSVSLTRANLYRSSVNDVPPIFEILVSLSSFLFFSISFSLLFFLNSALMYHEGKMLIAGFNGKTHHYFNKVEDL